MKLVRFAAKMLFVFTMLCFSGVAQQAGAQGLPTAAEQAGNGPSAWPEWTCESFPDGRDAAVTYFDTNGGPATLDPDGDGIACNEEDGSTSGPSAWPEWTCHTFPEGWDAAIDYFATNGGPATLDPDGDGIACNEGPDATVECENLTESQAVAQDYFEANGSPYNLDMDGDGLACASPDDGYFGTTEDSPAPASDDEDVTESNAGSDGDGILAGTAESASTPQATGAVAQLPSTGSGSTGTPSSVLIILLLIATATMVGLAGLTSRRTTRR